MFGAVYENNGWGAAPDGRRYYSDSPAQLTAPLRKQIGDFIRDHAISTVVDLGCGDFELASGIDMHGAQYVGLDLYPPLIEWNQARFGSPARRFELCDIVEDPLPEGDLCMINCVLYMLSEQDVRAILAKITQYRYVLITDGQPAIPVDRRRNIDKPTDKYNRNDYYSNGFYLELPPYQLRLEVLLEDRLPSGEIMRTVLIRHGET